MRLFRILIVFVLVGAVVGTPNGVRAAQIDEIAYFSNKALKELSRYIVSIVGSPQLGTCGRRRDRSGSCVYPTSSAQPSPGES